MVLPASGLCVWVTEHLECFCSPLCSASPRWLTPLCSQAFHRSPSCQEQLGDNTLPRMGGTGGKRGSHLQELGIS